MSFQKLDDNEVEQLLRAGRTQGEVVQLYSDRGVSVSQSAISQAISSGRIKVDTRRSTGGIPWKLKVEHRHLHHARMLRTQARLDRDLPIGRSLVPQVKAWQRALRWDDAVIHYDPDTDEGFWRVPRRPGVDRWWVRDPTLDDNGLTVEAPGRRMGIEMSKKQPSLGQRIRAARERQMPRMSQLQLSRLVGVSTVKTVNNWENDRSQPQNWMTRLEEVLGDLREDDRSDRFALEKAEIRAMRFVSEADKEVMIATLYPTPEGPQPPVRRHVAH